MTNVLDRTRTMPGYQIAVMCENSATQLGHAKGCARKKPIGRVSMFVVENMTDE
jgi:hypothetical protein